MLFKKIFSLLICFISLSHYLDSRATVSDFTYPFTEWKKICLKLPKEPNSFQSSLIESSRFVKTITQSIELFKSIHNNNPWIDNKKWKILNPFAEKKVIEPNSTLFFFGDLHGNIHALIQLLDKLKENLIINDNFEIIKQNSYLIFLGDYVDRGWYGVETLYTILRLKLANPENVFMVRGNHEDMELNSRFGFLEELQHKFGKQYSYDLFSLFYEYLPSVLYIGCANKQAIDYVQCCHGGIEIGYNPRELLNNSQIHAFECIEKFSRSLPIRNLPGNLKPALIALLPQNELLDHIPDSPTQPVHNGFMWNDFVVNDNTKIVDYIKGRGWIYGKSLTEYFLNTQQENNYAVRAIFRAHQHYGDMLRELEKNNGIVNLWDGLVYTFLSAPIRGIDFSHAACGIVGTAQKFEDWKIDSLVI